MREYIKGYVVTIGSLFLGAAFVHNIYKPDLVGLTPAAGISRGDRERFILPALACLSMRLNPCAQQAELCMMQTLRTSDAEAEAPAQATPAAVPTPAPAPAQPAAAAPAKKSWWKLWW